MTNIDADRPSHDPGQERADLVETLRAHRAFLRHTVGGLDDEQATRRTTISELCLGGLIKHVSHVEANWVRFILEGPNVMAGFDEAAMAAHAASFRVLEGETLAGLLADYEAVAARTDELVMTLPSLDASQPLPEAPWFPPNARRTARRVFMHIVAETAQHAGHADILREALDGQKTMG
ncbi:MAG TPA: DinB family protein [Acidimicrobiales bacterium]|nr:DinB family protein [Acidimicrobiales bacterium]